LSVAFDCLAIYLTGAMPTLVVGMLRRILMPTTSVGMVPLPVI
jgi:hypothetical protein